VTVLVLFLAACGPPKLIDAVRGSSSTCVRRPVRTERFVLSIDGLSCACCPSGLVKAIKQIPAIHGYHLNLALARLEIDLDIDHGSIDEVILQLHAPTGYTFEAYTCTEGQVLELLVDDVAEVRRWIQPKGVLILDTDEKQSWTPCRIFSGRSSVMSADRMRRTVSLRWVWHAGLCAKAPLTELR
jgi:hypothetical protein